MRNLLGPSHDANLIQGPNLRTQSTMHAQYFPINDRSQSEEVEDLATRLPHRGVTVFLLAFFVEAVDLGDLSGLVVAADESYFIRVSGRRQYHIGTQVGEIRTSPLDTSTA